MHGGDRCISWEVVAQFFAGEGFTVSVVNPDEIKAYAASRLTRSKTVAIDARIIVEHVIAGVKRCRIMKDVFRIKRYGYDDLVMEMAYSVAHSAFNAQS